MKELNVNNIDSVAVSGLDITIRQNDGSIKLIKNGVTSLLKGELSITSSNGEIFSKSQILNRVNLEGSSAILIPELLSSDKTSVKENNRNNSEQEKESITISQGELDKLEEQLKELKKLREELEKKKEEEKVDSDNTDLVQEDLDVLNKLIDQALESTILFAQNSLLENIVENVENDNTSKKKSNNDQLFSSSSSSSGSAQNIEETEDDSKNEELFVEIQLSSRSDSGAKGDFITNVKKPSFEGKTLPGAKITLTIEGVSHTVLADSNGSFLLSLPNDLEDGDYVIRVEATDDAGNSVSINQQLTIDTVAPEITFSLQTDTGFSDSDKVTNVNKPTFIGSVSGNPETITIVVGDLSYSIPAENGQFSFTIPVELSDGKYEFKLVVTDEAGNKSEMVESVTIDTVNDFSVQLSSISDSGELGDWTTNQTKPIIRIDHEAGSKLQVLINGSPLEISLNSTPPTIFQFSEELKEGVYKLQFISTDLAGNKLEVEETLTIDLTPPTFEFLGLSDESNTGDKTDNLTSNSKPTFNGKAEPNSKIYLSVDGVTLEAKSNDKGYWSISLDVALSDGEYQVSAYAQDVAGNISNTDIVAITIDTVGPMLSGGFDTNYDSGISNTDGITNSDLLKFKGKTESGASVRLQIFEISFDEKFIVKENGSFEFEVNEVPEGSYTYKITATDAAGNESINSLEGKIVVDKSITNFSATMSSESDSGSYDDDKVTNVKLPKFSGTGEPGSSITISISKGGESILPSYGPAVVNESGDWEYIVPDSLVDGGYEAKFTITDLAGNTAETSFAFIIDSVSEFSAEMDRISDSELADGITNVDRPSFSGSAEAGARVTLVLTNVLMGKTITLETVADSQGNWLLKPSDNQALSDQGEWVWSSYAIDIAGNKSSIIQGSFIFDNIAPNAEVSLESPVGFVDNHTNDSTIDLRITTEVNSSVIVSLYRVENSNILTQPIYTSDIPVVVDNSGSIAYSIPNLEDGNYAYRISVKDIAGNVHFTDFYEVKIDTTLPDLGSISLTDSSDSGALGDNITNEVELSVKGNGSEIGSMIHFSIRNVLTGESVSVQPASYLVQTENWIFPIKNTFSDGLYEISFYAEDSAGNISSSEKITVTIDTTPPILGGVILSTDSDTGISDSDFITNNKTPKFIGSSEIGSTVTVSIFRNGVLYKTSQTKVTNDDGTWDVTFPELAQGRYTWTVSAKDIAGNETILNEINQTLVIDTAYIGATAFIADETNSGDKNDNITNNQNVVLTGSGEIGSSVKLKSLLSPLGNSINIDAIGPSIIDNNGSWTLSLPLLSFGEGEYSWVLVFTDIAGNSVERQGTIILDLTTNLTATLVSDTGSSNSDGIINDNTPTFSGEGEVGGRVTIVLKGENGLVLESLPVTVPINGNWTITLPEVSDGRYTWSAKIIDIAGNEFSTEDKVLVLDTISPIIIDVQLQTEGAFESEPTQISIDTPSFGGKTSESSSQVIVNIFAVQAGVVSGSPLYTSNSVISDSLGNFTVQVDQSLPEGEYRWSVTVSDVAGNQAVSSLSSFVVDKTPPALSDVSLSEDSDTSLIPGTNFTSDSTPTFSGKSEPGSRISIELYDNLGNLVEIDPDYVTVGNNGVWNFTAINEIEDGNYTWYAIAQDAAGNITKSNSISLNVDTKSPLLTEVILSENSDTGLSNSDGITSDRNPVFQGKSESGSKIVLKLYSSDSSSTAAFEYETFVTSSNGSWSIQASNLPEGNYSWQILAIDPAGNTSTYESTKPLVIDTSVTDFTAQLDSDSDTGELNNDGITNKSQVNLSGTAEPNATVQLLTLKNITTNTSVAVNSVSALVNAEGEWAFTTPGLTTDGVYEWVVKVTDIAGNTAELTGRFTFDKTITVSGDLSSDSDSGASANDNITNETKPTFDGRGQAGDKITLVLTGPNNYREELSTTVKNDGSWSITLSDDISLSNDGIYQWVVTAVDIAGNTAEDRGTFTLDTSAPTVTTDLLNDSGWEPDDAVTKHNELSIKAVVAGGGYEARLIVWKNGETSANAVFDETVRLNGLTEYTFTTSSLPDHTYQYKVVVVDVAGNSSESAVSTVVVDSTAPLFGEVTQSGLSNGSYTNESEISFSGTAEANSRVYLTLRLGSEIISVQPPYVEVGADGRWSYTLLSSIADTLADGEYSWSFSAEDSAGNRSSEKSGQFTLDTQLPVVSFSGLSTDTDSGTANDDMLTNVDRPTFKGSVTESAFITVQLTSIPAGTSYTFTTTASVNGEWSLTADKAIKEGSYQVVIFATDLAGNVSDNLAINTNLVIDKTVVGGDEIGLDAASDSGIKGDQITNETEVTIKGTVEPGSRVVLKSLISPSGDAINVSTVAAIIADQSGNWSLILPSFGIEQGAYVYTVTYTDLAGNTKDVTEEFIFDSHISITGSLTSENVTHENVIYTKDNTPQLAGTGQNGDKITLTISGPGLNRTFEAVVGSNGQWEITLPELSRDGVYNWSIVATDAAGNTDTGSLGQFTLDTTAPTITSLMLIPNSDLGHSSTDGITNVTSPTVSVVTSGAFKVQLLVWESGNSTNVVFDSTLVSVGSNGQNTFTISPALSEGDYQYQLIALDVAGNRTISDVKDLEIDTTLPELGSVILSGAENGHYIDSDKLILTGTGAEAGARIYLALTNSSGAITISPSYVTVGKDGTWSFSVTEALSDGTYSWTVFAEDAAGNHSASLSNQVVVDTSAPTIEFNGLTSSTNSGDNSDLVTNALKPILTGSTSEPGTVKVVLQSGSNRYEFTVNNNDGGAWSFEIPEIAEGSYSITLVAKDLAGNESAALVVNESLVIDRTVSGGNDFGLSTDTDTGTSNSDNITKETSVKLSGNVEPGSTVTLISLVSPTGSSIALSGVLSTTSDGQGDWTLSVPSFGLANGEYTYQLKYVDVAGNEKTVDGVFVFDNSIDLSASLQSTTAVVDGTTYTNVDRPVFSGTGNAGDRVEITITRLSPAYSQKISTEVLDNGTWSVTSDVIALDGDYTWSAIASDVAGNTREVQGSFTLDTTPPSATVSLTNDSGFVDNDGITNETALTFNVATSGSASKVKFELWAKGAPGTLLYSQEEVLSSGTALNFTTSVLGEGTYEYRVIVEDIAGNQFISTVAEVEIDTTAPSIGNVSIEDVTNGNYLNEQGVTFKGTAEAGSRVYLTLSANGSAVVISPESVEVGQDGSWTYTLASELSDGEYTYSFVAIDVAGNRSQVREGTIHMDTVPPTAVYTGISASTDSGILDNDGITKEQMPVFEGTVNESAIVTVVLTAENGTRYVYTSGSFVNGSWSIQGTDNLPEGTYQVSVSATDKAGNVGPVSESELKIDLTVIGGDMNQFGLDDDSDSGVKGDQITNDNEIAISGNVESGSTVTIVSLRSSEGTIIDVSSINSVIASAEGKWSLILPTLVEGHYTYTIRYNDVAGNTKDVNHSFTVDRSISVSASFDSQTGVDSSNNIYTNIDAPSFSGIGLVGDRVTITLIGPNGYNEVFNTVLSSNAWSIAIPTLVTDGSYSWSMIAQDAAGNIQPQITGSFILDTVLPELISARIDEVSDTGLSDSDGITRDTSPDFIIRGEVGSKVIVQLWGGLSTTGSALWTSSEFVIGAAGSITVAYPEGMPLSDGRYVWKVTLTDIAGNETVSSTQHLQIDTTAPSLSEVILNSDTGVNNSDWITNDNTPLISGKGEAGARITLVVKKDGALQSITPAFVTVDNNGLWSYQLSNTLGDGEYSIQVVATDTAGNITSTIERNLVIDTVAPSLSDVRLAQESDSGTNNSDGITNNTLPVFKGIAEVGSTVTLVIKRGESIVNSWDVVVLEGGSWQITLDEALLEGEYSWVVTATDIAGNTSEELTGNITIDTSIEVFDVKLDTLDDTGLNNTDSITNRTSVSLSGNGENGSKVSLLTLSYKGSPVNVSNVGSVDVANGSWKLSLPDLNLGDGQYSYVVRIVDVAGNTVDRSGGIFLDTKLPTLTAGLDPSSDSGDNTDGITNDTTPTFVGSVDERSQVTVQLFQNGNQVGATYGPVTTDGAWSIDITSALQDGTYTWKVTAIDVAGNESVKNGAITIDTVAPIISIALDSEDDSGVSQSDGITKEQNLVFKGNVAGEGSESVELRFEFHRTGGDKNSPLIQHVLSGSDFSFSVAAPTDGNYTWKLIAIDIAGNEKQLTGNVTVDTIIDAFSNDTGLNSDSDSGASNSDGLSNDRTPSFTGRTEPFAKVVLVMTFGGTQAVRAEAVAGENGIFTINVPDSQSLSDDGSYNWTLTATDIAGNSVQKQGVYNLDTTAPVIAFDLVNDSGNNEDWITNSKNFVISGSSNDSADVKLTLRLGSVTLINEATLTPISGSWSYNHSSELNDGIYTVIVSSTDEAGNTYHSEKTLTIDTQIINEFELFNDTGVSDSDNITNAQNLEFRGRTDKDAQVVLKVFNSEDVELYVYRPVVDATSGQWAFVLPTVLPEGTYQFVTLVTDVAGNTNTSDEYIVEIDRTPPLLTGITLDSNDDTGIIGDWITETTQVSISGFTSIGASVRVLIQGIDQPVIAVVGADGTFTAELPELAYGIYSLTIIASDVAGNNIQREQSLTVSPDVLPFRFGLDINSDSGEKGDNVTNITTPTISGSATPGYKIEANINGVTYSGTANEAGVWSIRITNALTEGEHTIIFVVKDSAGNTVAPEGESYDFTVDTSVSTTISLDIGSDSGEKGDFITNANNVYVTGVSEKGTKITIKDKSTLDIVTQFSVTNSGWGYIFEALSEGVHNYIVELVDLAGNKSTQEFNITIDRTPPSLIAKIGESENITNIVSRESTQTFSGSAIGASEVTITINGVKQSISVSDDGTWSKVIELKEGINNISIQASDEAGNISTIQGVVNIKTSVKFTMNLEDDNGRFPTDKVISGTKIALGGSGGVGDNVRLTLTNENGESKELSLTIGATGLWQAEFIGLSDGVYSVTANVTDDAGNSLERTIVDIQIDNQYVNFTASLIDDAGVEDDGNINDSRPTFRGTGEAGAQVVFVIGANSFTSEVSSSGTWQFRLPIELLDGEHEITIYSIDLAGNQSTAVNIDFAVDTVVPQLDYAIDGVFVNNDKQYLNSNQDILMFRGNASEAGKVTLQINNQEFAFTVANGGGEWSIDVGSIAEQSHAYTLVFEDIAGNKIVKAGNVIVDKTINAYVTLSGDTNSAAPGHGIDSVTNFKTLKFVFANQGFSTDRDVRVSVVVTGPAGFSESFANIDPNHSWTMPVQAEADGNYRFAWRFVDDAGNTTERSSTITVDTTINPIDLGDLSYEGTSINPEQTLVVNKNLISIGYNPTEAYSVVKITINGATYDAVRTSNGWRFPGLSLSEGVNNFTLTVWDSAGNSSTVNSEIRVKTSFDILEFSIDSDVVTDIDNVTDVISNNEAGEVVLSGKTDVGTTFEIFVNGSSVKKSAVDINGNWNYKLELDEGSNRIMIKFVDVAGNEKSLTFNATIDTIAPIVTLETYNGDGYQLVGDNHYIKGTTLSLGGRLESGVLITAVTINGSAAEYTGNKGSNGIWNIDISGLDEGKNDIVIKFSDAAGNIFNQSITVDRDLTVQILEGKLVDPNSDNLVNLVAFEGKVEQGSTVVVEVTNTASNEKTTLTATVNSDGNWNATSSGLADGEYSWVIKA
ncbi:Ig-like domain-containing protein, partial [Vibrio vulnificus]|uniref:Ig-like domain-containing protein n=1 Tax=Vibrio vulnificus TaxID=672 RepID=UPI0004FF9105